MFVDKNGDYESLLVVVIVLAVIAVVAIIAGVILLILHIKLRAAYKRSYSVNFLCRNTMTSVDFCLLTLTDRPTFSRAYKTNLYL